MTKIRVLCPHCDAEITAELNVRRVGRRRLALPDTDDVELIQWYWEIHDFVKGKLETSTADVGAHLGLDAKALRAPANKKLIGRALRKMGWFPLAVRDGKKVVRRWRTGVHAAIRAPEAISSLAVVDNLVNDMGLGDDLDTPQHK